MDGSERIYSYQDYYGFYVLSNFEISINLLLLSTITIYLANFKFFDFFLKTCSQMIILGPLLLVGSILTFSFGTYNYIQKAKEFDSILHMQAYIKKEGIIKSLDYTPYEFQINLEDDSIQFNVFENPIDKSYEIISFIKEKLNISQQIQFILTKNNYLLEVYIKENPQLD